MSVVIEAAPLVLVDKQPPTLDDVLQSPDDDVEQQHRGTYHDDAFPNLSPEDCPESDATDSALGPDAAHAFFAWLGWAPPPESPCAQTLHRCFPGALPGQAVLKRAAAAVGEFGLTPENTLYGQSICPDEINNERGDLASLMADYWGECFPMGGIGGAPFAGKTGFSAYSHHVPDDGHLFIVFGPHISISETGELAKYKRIGQKCESTACGAVMAAYQAVKKSRPYKIADSCISCTPAAKAVESKVEIRRDDEIADEIADKMSQANMGEPEGGKMSLDPNDMQQEWLKEQVRKRFDEIEDADEPLNALIHVVYNIIKEQMFAISNHDFGPGKLVLLGGVQINMPSGYEDHFEPLCFQFSSRDGTCVNLLQSLAVA